MRIRHIDGAPADCDPGDEQAIPVIVTDEAPIVDLASRRPVVERLTPAAHRLINTAVGDLRERLGDACTTATPPIEAVYLGDGKASIAIVLTFPVAEMNARADDRLSDRERAVLAALTETWCSAEAIGVAAGTGWCLLELRALKRLGLACQAGGEWRLNKEVR